MGSKAPCVPCAPSEANSRQLTAAEIFFTMKEVASRKVLISFSLLWILISSFASPSALANPKTELFFSQVTSGVLMGALLGTATLAFTERPADNLQNIARGASLGLYAGILVGLYQIYVVPYRSRNQQILVDHNFGLAPVFNPQGQLVGATGQFRVYRF